MNKLVSFYNSHKELLLAVVISIICFSFVVSYIQDSLVTKYTNSQNTELIKLQTKIHSLSVEKEALRTDRDNSIAEFIKLKTQATELQHKTDNLLKVKPSYPTTVSVQYSQDCIDSLNELNSQWSEREKQLASEILVLRPALVEADKSIKLLKEEIIVSNKIIAVYEEKDIKSSTLINTLNKQVETEKSRKKVYRSISIGSVILIIVLL